MNIFNLINTKFNKIKDILISLVGLIFFKLKYSSTKWLRPVKIGTFFSQAGQDFYLSSLLFGPISRNLNNDKLWIIDVGCNHPINYNNSYFFEKYLGCSVLAIDPISEFSQIWAKKRPDSIFYTTAVGESTGFINLNLPVSPTGDNMFSFVDSAIGKHGLNGFIERKVSLNKLSDILDENSIKEILLLSIDVEGFEFNTIKGINFDKFLIRCILVENNSESLYGSDNIRSYLKGKNYTFYARIGHLDDIFIHNSMIRGL